LHHLGGWHRALNTFQKLPKTAIILYGDPSYKQYTSTAIDRLTRKYNATIYECPLTDLNEPFEKEITLNNKTISTTHIASTSIAKILASITKRYDLLLCLEYNTIAFTPPKQAGFFSPSYLAFGDTYPSACIYTDMFLNTGALYNHDIPTLKNVFSYLYGSKVNFSSGIKTDMYDTVPNSKIFVICSIVNITFTNRSKFSSRERLEQTVRQIMSIRENVDNAYIVILETSQCSLHQLGALAELSDKLYLFDDDTVAQHYANKDPNKSKAEVYVMTILLQRFKELNTPFSHVMKFGGRYQLSHLFTSENLFRDYPTFLHVSPEITWSNKPCVVSVLYSIPKEYFDTYLTYLITTLTNLNQNPQLDIEHALFDYCKDFKSLDFIGISGYFAGNQVVAQLL
jgi:hypothetical protein